MRNQGRKERSEHENEVTQRENCRKKEKKGRVGKDRTTRGKTRTRKERRKEGTNDGKEKKTN